MGILSFSLRYLFLHTFRGHTCLASHVLCILLFQCYCYPSLMRLAPCSDKETSTESYHPIKGRGKKGHLPGSLECEAACTYATGSIIPFLIPSHFHFKPPSWLCLGFHPGRGVYDQDMIWICTALSPGLISSSLTWPGTTALYAFRLYGRAQPLRPSTLDPRSLFSVNLISYPFMLYTLQSSSRSFLFSQRRHTLSWALLSSSSSSRTRTSTARIS